MKKIFLLLTFFANVMLAQNCVQIQDTLYSIGPVAPILTNGSLLVQLGYFLTDGTFRITQSVTTINIVAGVLNTCLPPAVYKINYTVRNPNNTPTQYSTYWYIPHNLSGPFKLSDVPAGIVNTSDAAQSLVTWVSGLDFSNVSLVDTPVINGMTYPVVSISSSVLMTVNANAGAQTGTTFTDGAIERPVASGPIPPTISGTPGLSPLNATTTALGGSLLNPGDCIGSTLTVTGASTAMVVDMSPAGVNPGQGVTWRAFVISANTIEAFVCAYQASVPISTAYNIRVIQ